MTENQEFKKKWMSKVKPLVLKGASYAAIGDAIGVKRQWAAIIVEKLGLKDLHKQKRDYGSKEWKCKVCGVDVPARRITCDKHRQWSTDEYPCKKCGCKTIPNERRKGMCLSCYSEHGEKNEFTCELCGSTTNKLNLGLCSKCYIRIRKRAENEVPIDKWRSTIDIKLEKKFFRIIKNRLTKS